MRNHGFSAMKMNLEESDEHVPLPFVREKRKVNALALVYFIPSPLHQTWNFGLPNFSWVINQDLKPQFGPDLYCLNVFSVNCSFGI